MARKRGTETIGDMVRSMLVVLIPVALIAGFVGLVRPSTAEVRDVDWESTLEAARDGGEFAAVGPAELPDGWTATRVAYDRGASASDDTWRMSFVTDTGDYVGIVQRSGDVVRIVRSELPDLDEDGTTLIAGDSWQRYVGPDADGDRALVLESPDSVVVVLTSASDYSVAESFASSLR